MHRAPAAPGPGVWATFSISTPRSGRATSLRHVVHSVGSCPLQTPGHWHRFVQGAPLHIERSSPHHRSVTSSPRPPARTRLGSACLPKYRATTSTLSSASCCWGLLGCPAVVPASVCPPPPPKLQDNFSRAAGVTGHSSRRILRGVRSGQINLLGWQVLGVVACMQARR